MSGRRLSWWLVLRGAAANQAGGFALFSGVRLAVGLGVLLACHSPGRAEDPRPLPPITALAFAPAGTHVLVGSQGGLEVRVWPELKVAKVLETRLSHVHDLTFAPDGSAVYAAGGAPGESGQVELFSWPDGKLLHSFSPHNDLIYQIAARPDGQEFATASADHGVNLQEVSGGKPRRLAGHSRGVFAVAYVADGEWLVSAGADQSLRVWSAADGRLLRTLDNHTDAVNVLAARPGKTEGPALVASAGADKTVRLWQPTIGRLVRFARLPSAPLALVWSADGSRLAAACVDGRVRVLDPDAMRVVLERPALEGWAYSLALAPRENVALVGGPRSELKAISLAEDGP